MLPLCPELSGHREFLHGCPGDAVSYSKPRSHPCPVIVRLPSLVVTSHQPVFRTTVTSSRPSVAAEPAHHRHGGPAFHPRPDPGHRPPGEPPSPIRVFAARRIWRSLSQIVYCFVYVVPLYASPATKPSPTRSRDAPEAIRARIRAVSFSTATCSLFSLLLLYLPSHDGAPPQSPWHLLGYWPLGLVEAAGAVGLTALLFAGPLYEALVIDGDWRLWPRLEPLTEIWSDWATWRNLVAVRIPFPSPSSVFAGLPFTPLFSPFPVPEPFMGPDP